MERDRNRERASDSQKKKKSEGVVSLQLTESALFINITYQFV